MAKNTLKLHIKFIVADFLLVLGYDAKRLFIKSWDVTCVYQISYVWVKHAIGGCFVDVLSGGAMEPF